MKRSLTSINSKRLFKGIVAVVLVLSLTISTGIQPVQAASQTIPMTLRPASSDELAALEATLSPVILGQTGSPINASFSETSQTVHTGRAWVATASPALAECVTEPTISIIGDHTITHVANDTTPLPNPSDEPEAGATLIDGNGSLVETLASNTDFAVGASLSVVSSGAISSSVVNINSGIKILMYVETRDDVSQDGAQSSFSYSGIPQLKLDYNDASCPAVPGIPKTGIKPTTNLLLPTVFGTLSIGVISLGIYSASRFIKKSR